MSSEFSTIEKAIEDLSKGKLVIVVDDENRENEGDLVAIAENKGIVGMHLCRIDTDVVSSQIPAQTKGDIYHEFCKRNRQRILDLRGPGTGVAHFKKQYAGGSLACIFTYHKQRDGNEYTLHQRQGMFAVGNVFMRSLLERNFPMVREGMKPIFEYRIEKDISSSADWYYHSHVSIDTDNSKWQYGTTAYECRRK